MRPQDGQLVLVGGYPKALREEDVQAGSIGAGHGRIERRTCVAGGRAQLSACRRRDRSMTFAKFEILKFATLADAQIDLNA